MVKLRSIVSHFSLEIGCAIDDLDNGCPINSPYIFYGALKHSTLRNLKWILENQCPVDQKAKSTAKNMFGSFEKLLQLLKVDPSIVIHSEQPRIILNRF